MVFGYVIDTSVLIRFERSRIQTMDMLTMLRESLGSASFAVSAITMMELAYGVSRAESETHRLRRTEFGNDLSAAVEVEDVTLTIAQSAGKLRGTMSRSGLVLPAEDLLIGVTALHLGYAVLTHNTRHFEMIPGLEVVAPTFTL